MITGMPIFRSTRRLSPLGPHRHVPTASRFPRSLLFRPGWQTTRQVLRGISLPWRRCLSVLFVAGQLLIGTSVLRRPPPVTQRLMQWLLAAHGCAPGIATALGHAPCPCDVFDSMQAHGSLDIHRSKRGHASLILCVVLRPCSVQPCRASRTCGDAGLVQRT